ncbi:hypothetical protein CMQ_2568 [Grosmannia clavigera kw1407]|uniref:Uncharacterized protein n=1 Tax=Grosmannia clavigera (strain kw1407 / UAMH 11150) TaxID=655863 RepID=F0XGS7_GROCL|nr:uncharacterized protein CMQ_2568 [Grosmannia clavigera kw1407]EFX02639.1 hypothetical protein CMQ_2568 [Grosmannia clavigera kw1407]
MPPPVPPSSQPPPVMQTPNAPHFLLLKRPDRPAATPTHPRHDTGAPGWLTAGETPGPATVRSSQPRPTPRFVPSWTQSQSTPVRADDEIDEDSSPPRAALKPTAEMTTMRAADGTTGLPRPTQPTQPTPSASRTLWQPRWQSARRPQVREDIEDAEDSDLDLDDDGGEPIDGLSLASNSIEEQAGLESGSEAHGESGEEQPHQQLQSPARPFKRRRLFVSPGRDGKITRKVGRRQGQLVDDIEEGNDDSSDADGNDNEDNDDETFGDYYRGRQMSYDEMGEILEDEELRHSWEPPDEKADVYDAEEEDFMILNATPSRRNPSGRRTKTETETRLEQQQPPTFQRSRLFLSMGKSDTTATRENAVDARNVGTLDDDNGEDTKGYGDSDENNEDTGNARADRQQQQEHRHPPPDFFSPRKRQRRRGRQPLQQRGGTPAATAASVAAAAPVSGDGQFVAGGLAAELRNWLVQIKVQARSNGQASGSTGSTSTSRPLRYVVEEARLSSGMCLVLGRPEAEVGVEAKSNTALRLLLAGDGRWAPAAMLAGGVIVEIVPPVWDVVIEGETWTVASSWAVE